MKTKNNDPAAWQERVQPLMKRLVEVGARCTWEGYATLNTDRPRQKDIIIQHWLTSHSETMENGYERNWSNLYIVQIWSDGSGWNVFSEVCKENDTAKTLAAIV
jgi:hypothetical protein